MQDITLDLGALMKTGTQNTLPDPRDYRYWKGILEDSTYYLDEEITDDIDLIYRLIEWNKQTWNIDKPIIIYFNSPGGQLDTGLSVHNAIRISKRKVIGINLGQCASAAALIFSACHERYSLPYGNFMCHHGSADLSGNHRELKSAQKFYDEQIDIMIKVIADSMPNTSIEEVKDKMENDWYFSSEKALQLGFIHEIKTTLDF